jgi:hypothetical protein
MPCKLPQARAVRQDSRVIVLAGLTGRLSQFAFTVKVSDSFSKSKFD